MLAAEWNLVLQICKHYFRVTSMQALLSCYKYANVRTFTQALFSCYKYARLYTSGRSASITFVLQICKHYFRVNIFRELVASL